MKKRGILFRKNSLWIGLHYSRFNRRYCLNILPMFTIWWIKDGGIPPTENKNIEDLIFTKSIIKVVYSPDIEVRRGNRRFTPVELFRCKNDPAYFFNNYFRPLGCRKVTNKELDRMKRRLEKVKEKKQPNFNLN